MKRSQSLMRLLRWSRVRRNWEAFGFERSMPIGHHEPTEIRQLCHRWQRAIERNRAESEACSHDGKHPYCITCVTIYVHMP